jgi:hypothetical protein
MINRRSFLKGLGIAVLSPVLPDLSVLDVPDDPFNKFMYDVMVKICTEIQAPYDVLFMQFNKEYSYSRESLLRGFYHDHNTLPEY